MEKVTDKQVLKDILQKELVNVKIKFRASGYKSSEGDGRTAADIEKELLKNGS